MVLPFSFVHILCYHFFIIFKVLSFMLSFDVIVFHGQQMLSFLCYHFPLYIFIIYVIIFRVLSFMISFDVIIYGYHFPPFFFFLKTWHTFQEIDSDVTWGADTTSMGLKVDTFLGSGPEKSWFF